MPDATNPAPEVPKSLFGKILTYTPVVMTVLGTLLAGLSTGEMNTAQYDRATAAQRQAKVADQWNYFQVKRARGASAEGTLDLLRPLSHPSALEPARLAAAAGQFPTLVAAARDEARLLLAALGGPGGPLAALRAAAEACAASTSVAAEDAAGLGPSIQALAQPGVQAALKGISQGQVASVDDRVLPDGAIRSAIAAIEARKPDDLIVPIVASVANADLDHAIEDAQGNSAAFDEAVRPAGDALDRTAAVLLRQAVIAGTLGAAVKDLAVAATTLPSAALPAEVRSSLDRLVSSAAKLQEGAEKLSTDFTAAKLAYAARRYEREARYNGALAQLYEVQVRASGRSADRHLTRSRLFFFGMLGAQAAVVVATLALAVRQRNLLWTLAAATGLFAVAFGVYVYLFT